jgi:hypothetical protein
MGEEEQEGGRERESETKYKEREKYVVDLLKKEGRDSGMEGQRRSGNGGET